MAKELGEHFKTIEMKNTKPFYIYGTQSFAYISGEGFIKVVAKEKQMEEIQAKRVEEEKAKGLGPTSSGSKKTMKKMKGIKTSKQLEDEYSYKEVNKAFVCYEVRKPQPQNVSNKENNVKNEVWVSKIQINPQKPYIPAPLKY